MIKIDFWKFLEISKLITLCVWSTMC